MHESLRQFHPVVGRWFETRVGTPTPPQVMGWPVIGAGKSALIVAPTGSGKTLAAFLAGIDWVARRLLAAEGAGGAVWGVQILYISPLKALANDVQKNLLQPLRELADVAAEMGEAWPEIHVGVRTGDTPQRERAAMVRQPPHILITTPESLNLMLMAGARAGLATTRYVIVDEVHALAGNKRGVFLSLLLERLEEERARHVEVRGAGGEGKGERRKAKDGTVRGRFKIAPGVYVATEPYVPLVRVGLSATVRPEEGIAHWLGGDDAEGRARAMEVVRTGQRKRLDLQVVCPFSIGGDADEAEVPQVGGDRKAAVDGKARPKGTGHWPEVTRELLRLIRAHRSTLVFGNSRRLVEGLASRLQELVEGDSHADMLLSPGESDEKSSDMVRRQKHATPPVILPHHGSIAKEVRLETEQALKRGELDAVLATSSLELGIDIGSLDLVVQIDSPGNVAAGLQRVGRAGHLEKATAKGRMLARGSFELASFGALLPLMYQGVVEETHVPANCLDVLAQQVVAACVTRSWRRGDLYRMFRRAMPYRGLSEKQFDAVVGMLSKRAERVTAAGLRPRLSFDRVNDELIIMPGAAKIALVNGGVIADTGQFPVYLAGTGKHAKKEEPSPREAQQLKWGKKEEGAGVRLGELDEEFVYETKEGDRIVLGSQTWRVVRIDADRVLVERAEPGSSRMPFWRGESAPRSEMLGEAVAQFYGEMERRLGNGGEEVQQWLMSEHYFDARAAENAVVYLGRQRARGALPHDKQVVVEHFVDRAGEPVIAILCPLGSRVNYALRLALENQFGRRRLPAQVVHNDDGLLIRPPVEMGEIPENPLAWLRSRTLEQEIVDQLEGTALFGMRFRQNAARALMLPRMTLAQRTPLWQQRLRARHLLALVKRERNFPIMVETYRECLQDVLAIEGVAEILRKIEAGEMTVRVVRQQEGGGWVEGSPFAQSLFSQFTASYLYEWDDPLVPAEIEPTVDQKVLDDILRRRAEGDGGAAAGGGDEMAKAWEEADERALGRRILGLDYPARTAEELLEKIEAAGAVGFGIADDARWREWVVGGEEDVRRMLLELSEKRRVLLAAWGKGKQGEKRWVATEGVALLLAARGNELKLYRWTGAKVVGFDVGELPAALLETEVVPEKARRLLVEQAIKRYAVTTAEAVAGELPWMAREAGRWVETLVREGLVMRLAGGEIVWAEYAEQLRTLALRRQRRGAATVDLAALQKHLLQWQHVLPAGASAGAAAGDFDSLQTVDAAEDLLDLLLGLSFPLEVWEYELLTARIPRYAPAVLDAICRGGHRVWVGGGASAPGDLAVSFWPRHMLNQRPVLAAVELSAVAQKVLKFLQERGASFQFDLQLDMALGEGDVALGLCELAGAGLVSSDQMESLRDVLRVAENAARDQARQPQPRLHGTHPPHSRPRLARKWWRSAGTTTAGNLGGRWFLLSPPAAPESALAVAQRAADRVERLLRRTGFACREFLESPDGPWKDAYDVLTRMEWTGTVRRGYFVDGIAGSQFAVPATRLDAHAASSETAITWLSMIDPANIWARASTRWISDSGLAARVPRTAGSWVALYDGRPVLAAVSWGQRLIPLPGPVEQQQQARATLGTLLPRLPRDRHPHLAVRYWDQQEVLGSPAEEALHRQGFTRDTQGMRLYRQYAMT